MNYKKLGDYITQRREKNTTINLPICGLCREGLIPPKQQDADISLYNVFYKNDFIFNPARMELNSITLNTEYDKAICSSLYEIFYINDTSKLLPEFLFVQLKTDNFVRFCEFQGQGSVREYCRFANISEYPVIVPDLKEQQKIVNTYNAITKRIQLKQKMNENLEKTAQCLFDKIYQNNESWTDGVISDLGEIVSGATPSTEIKEYFCQNGIHWLSPKDLTSTGYKFISKGETDITEAGYKSCSTKLMPKGTVLLTSRAPVGCLGIAENEICTNQGFKSIIPNADIQTAYIYYFLKKEVEMLKQNASGTTFDEISGSVLKSLKCKIPPRNIALAFNEQCKKIFNHQRITEKEIAELQELKQLVISRISGM